MKAYQAMIEEVFSYGTRKENRTGVDTFSTFNYNYELAWDDDTAQYRRPFESMAHYVLPVDESLEGVPIPLLTTKEISWKNIVVEMLWFLSGNTDIGILKQHGCGFWDPWADPKTGKVPSAYGNFWRRFPVEGEDSSIEYNDQLAWVLNTLRTNPMSRRCVINAWAPGNAQTSKLPPCHFAMVFNVQNVETGVDSNGSIDAGRMEQRLCLHLTQRSADLALGVPYNMASYGLLLAIMSHLTGIKPGIFAHTLLDLHVYTKKPDGSMAEYDHMPGLSEQLKREPKKVPNVVIDPSIKELSDIEALMKPEVSTEEILEKFKLVGYEPQPAIRFRVAV